MSKIGRREYLKTIGTGIVGFAVGLAVGSGVTYFVTRPIVKPPVVLGSLHDATGFLANYGYWHGKAVEAAVKYINEKEGGINGRPVELVWEDSASSTDIAVKKIRKLVLERGAVAIMPTPSGAIGLAVAPILKDELKVPYLYSGYTYTVCLQGNRYIFMWHGSIRSCIQAFAEIIPKIGKKWAIPYIDYAFGWSMRDEYKRVVKAMGGEVVYEMPIPVGTTDFYPYMAKIPKDVDGICWALVGLTESIGGVKALRELGYNQPIIGDIALWQGGNLKELTPLFEGCILDNVYPQFTSDHDTPAIREFRKWVGQEDDGAEVGNPKNYDINGGWLAWEGIFALADGMRAVDWKSKEDTPALIKWFEGRVFKESVHYPAGDFWIRPEDHHAFRPIYLYTVEKGKLKLYKKDLDYKKRIFGPPEVDRTKEPL